MCCFPLIDQFMWRRADAEDLCFTERFVTSGSCFTPFTLYLVVAVCMRVKHKVIFLKGKISLGKKKLGKIYIFVSVKELLCLLYKVAWRGWKSWWLYPESPCYQKHQEVAGVQKKIAYWSEWKSPACGVSCFLMHLSMKKFLSKQFSNIVIIF